MSLSGGGWVDPAKSSSTSIPGGLVGSGKKTHLTGAGGKLSQIESKCEVQDRVCFTH